MAIITREAGLTVAKGDTILAAGDELLMFSDGEHGAEVRAALGVQIQVEAIEIEHPHYE